MTFSNDNRLRRYVFAVVFMSCCVTTAIRSSAEDEVPTGAKSGGPISEGGRSSTKEYDAPFKINANTRHTTLEVGTGQSRVIATEKKIKRVESFDPKVVNVTAIKANAVRVTAQTTGLTTLVLVDEEDQKTAVTVRVPTDDALALRQMLKNLYPKLELELYEVRDSILIRGDVETQEQQRQIVEILEQYYANVLDQLKVIMKIGDDERVTAAKTPVHSSGLIDPHELREVRLPLRSTTGKQLLKKGDRVDVYQSIRPAKHVPYLKLVVANVELLSRVDSGVPFDHVSMKLPFEFGTQLLKRAHNVEPFYYLRPSTADSSSLTVDPANWGFKPEDVDEIGHEIVELAVLLAAKQDTAAVDKLMSVCRQLRVIYPSLKPVLPTDRKGLGKYSKYVEGHSPQDEFELATQVYAMLYSTGFDDASRAVAKYVDVGGMANKGRLIDSNELRLIPIGVNSASVPLFKSGDSVDVFTTIRRGARGGESMTKLLVANVEFVDGPANAIHEQLMTQVTLRIPVNVALRILEEGAQRLLSLRPSTKLSSRAAMIAASPWENNDSEFFAQIVQLAALLHSNGNAETSQLMLSTIETLGIVYPEFPFAVPITVEFLNEYLVGLDTKEQLDSTTIHKITETLKLMNQPEVAKAVLAFVTGVEAQSRGISSRIRTQTIKPGSTNKDDSSLRDDIRSLHNDVKRLIQILESREAAKSKRGIRNPALPVPQEKNSTNGVGAKTERLRKSPSAVLVKSASRTVDPSLKPPRPVGPTNAARRIGVNEHGKPTIDGRAFAEWQYIVELEPSAKALVPAVQALCSLGRKSQRAEVIDSLVDVGQRFLIIDDDGIAGADELVLAVIVELRRLDDDESRKALADVIRDGTATQRTSAILLAFYSLTDNWNNERQEAIPSVIRQALLDVADNLHDETQRRYLDQMLLSVNHDDDAGRDERFVAWLWQLLDDKSGIKTDPWHRQQALHVLVNIRREDAKVIARTISELEKHIAQTAKFDAFTYRLTYSMGRGLIPHTARLIALLKKIGSESGRQRRISVNSSPHYWVLSDRICMIEILAELGRDAEEAPAVIEELLMKTSPENWPTSAELNEVLAQQPILAQFQRYDSYGSSTDTGDREPKQFVISALQALYRITGEKPDVERLMKRQKE